MPRPQSVGFRHLWGQSKHNELVATSESQPEQLYSSVAPLLSLGLPFADLAVSDGWQDWPALPDLFPTSFPGVKTSRDGFLVDVDLDRLKRRVADYFNTDLSHEDIIRRYPGVMKSTARFDARAVRDALLKRGGRPRMVSFVMPIARSTPGGSIGNRIAYCWIVLAQNTSPHVFEGTFGSPPFLACAETLLKRSPLSRLI